MSELLPWVLFGMTGGVVVGLLIYETISNFIWNDRMRMTRAYVFQWGLLYEVTVLPVHLRCRVRSILDSGETEIGRQDAWNTFQDLHSIYGVLPSVNTTQTLTNNSEKR